MRRMLTFLIVGLAATAAEAASTPVFHYRAEFDPATAELVDKLLEGFGGETALSKVHVTHRTATTIQQGVSDDKPERIAIDSVSEYPNHHLVRVRAANGTMTLGIDEAISYLIPSPDKQKVKGAAIKLTPEERNDLIHYFSADPLFVVKMLHDPNYMFAAGEEVQLGDRKCQILHASISGLGLDWTVDLETGRLLRSTSSGETSEFSDWQQVGSISVPFRTRTTKDGSLFSETKLAKYEIDPTIDSRVVFRSPDLWLARWKVPPSRNYAGIQTVYVFLYWLD